MLGNTLESTNQASSISPNTHPGPPKLIFSVYTTTNPSDQKFKILIKDQVSPHRSENSSISSLATSRKG